MLPEHVRLALARAALLAVCTAIAAESAAPSMEIRYRAEQPGDWQAAIEARVAGMPARVRGDGTLWTVRVRPEDLDAAVRSLDWDGQLAFYVPCLEVEPEGTSAEVRARVEASTDGRLLYQATSVERALARCVVAPRALGIVPRGAEASLEAPAALVVTIDAADARALAALGESHAGATALVALRRTILSEVTLPLRLEGSTLRLPIVGGDIAPMYARFFAPGLRAPPLCRLVSQLITPVSPWSAVLALVLAAFGAALGWSELARSAGVGLERSRATLSLALGALAGAVSPLVVSCATLDGLPGVAWDGVVTGLFLVAAVWLSSRPGSSARPKGLVRWLLFGVALGWVYPLLVASVLPLPPALGTA